MVAGALCCSKHKKEGMFDVKGKRCNVEGCIRKPQYGYENQRAVRCLEHRIDGMVDLGIKVRPMDDVHRFSRWKEAEESGKTMMKD